MSPLGLGERSKETGDAGAGLALKAVLSFSINPRISRNKNSSKTNRFGHSFASSFLFRLLLELLELVDLSLPLETDDSSLFSFSLFSLSRLGEREAARRLGLGVRTLTLEAIAGPVVVVLLVVVVDDERPLPLLSVAPADVDDLLLDDACESFLEEELFGDV